MQDDQKKVGLLFFLILVIAWMQTSENSTFHKDIKGQGGCFCSQWEQLLNGCAHNVLVVYAKMNPIREITAKCKGRVI